MTDRPPPATEVVDITGPEGASLFWHAKLWLVADAMKDVQEDLDATWKHYKDIKDERLLALVGALCVETSVDRVLRSFAPGFTAYSEDVDFTFSVKLKVLRSLKPLPARLMTSCDLIRQIRNKFAHDLSMKALVDLDPKLLNRLTTQVQEFNPAPRDPVDYERQFRDLAGFVMMGLNIYATQLHALRQFLESAAGRESFKGWAEAKARA